MNIYQMMKHRPKDMIIHSGTLGLTTEELEQINTLTPFITTGFGLIKNMDYDINTGNLLYIGLAKPGTADDEEGWMIVKFFYDDNGNLIKIRYADGKIDFSCKWTERESYDYK